MCESVSKNTQVRVPNAAKKKPNINARSLLVIKARYFSKTKIYHFFRVQKSLQNIIKNVVISMKQIEISNIVKKTNLIIK